MQDTLQKTHAILTALKAQEEFGTTSAVSVAKTPAVDWQTSITKHAVACLECGQSFKQRTEPLAAKTTTARRREVAQEIRPWEKAPRFIQAHEHNGHASPEPEAEAAREEADEPTAEAPATAKRQRKATPKKTARKKSREG